MSNIEPGTKLPEGVERWPIERAFVPIDDIWRSTGSGTVGIIRRSPDGQCWSCIAPIQLNMGGITGFTGDMEKPLEQILGLYQKLTQGCLIPPSEEGSPELAARYLWGAYGWGLDRGSTWPPGTRKRFLNLFPPLAEKKEDWVRQFVKVDPLVPHNVQDMLRRFAAPDDLPEGKEVIVPTLMTLSVPDYGGMVAALRSMRALFQEQAAEGEINVFHWMKERRAAPGRKVVHGVIRIRPAEMTLEGTTLSSAAELAFRVRETVGSGPRLQRVRWMDVTQMSFAPPGMVRMPVGRMR
jgi:hypothetical protein